MKVLNTIKNNKQLIIVFAILISIAFSGGFYTGQYRANSNKVICPSIDTKAEENILGTSSDIISFSTSTINEVECTNYVELSGAVLNPSVICVQPTDRVVDIISKGGGFLSDSYAKKYVEQKLNLASYVSNGDKIYIPYQDDVVCKKKEEWSSPASVPLITQKSQSEIDFTEESGDGSGSSTSTSAQEGCVNINTASIEELDTLPGIGESTANKIIDGRPYEVKEDILNVSGIGDSIYLKIKDYICI